MQAHFGLAQLLAYQGRMDRALERVSTGLRDCPRRVPAATLQMEEALGVAYLHKAEMDNGVYRAPGDLCLLPLRPGQSYARTADAERAVEHFLKYPGAEARRARGAVAAQPRLHDARPVSGQRAASASDSAGRVRVGGGRRPFPRRGAASRPERRSRRPAA